MLLPVILFTILKIGFSICIFFKNRFMKERSIPNKFRSSRPQILLKIGVLKSFKKFHRKTSELESLFNKKKIQHRCFPVKFTKFLKTRSFYRAPPVAASINWNTEKSTILNSEGLKRGTKRLNMKNKQIFHFT